jgi:hypothetical protein
MNTDSAIEEDDDPPYIMPPKVARFYGSVVKGMKRASNAQAWALGTQQRNGFNVRRVVWGKLMAREERRTGEEIRKAVICVGPTHSR